MTENQPRHPAGTPGGGQFAPDERAEPTVSLDVAWEETEEFKAKFVKPGRCRRCAGRGMVETRVVHAGAPGGCFTCNGWGYVETDKATLAAAKMRAQAAREIITMTIDEAVRRGMPRHNAINVSYAISDLAENEPERYEKALASHINGHPGLFKALIAYTAEKGYFYYGSRKMTADEVFTQIDLD